MYDFDYDSCEDKIRISLAYFFKRKGREVESVSSRNQKGRDIVVLGAHKLIIEVKGYPTRFVTRGVNKGQEKTSAKRQTQAKKWVWDAVRQLVEHRSSHSRDNLAIALPATKFYRNYIDTVRWAIKSLRIKVFIVRSRKIEELVL